MENRLRGGVGGWGNRWLHLAPMSLAGLRSNCDASVATKVPPLLPLLWVTAGLGDFQEKCSSKHKSRHHREGLEKGRLPGCSAWQAGRSEGKEEAIAINTSPSSWEGT